MPPIVALGLVTGFILWLFRTDRKTWGRMSSSLWLPLLWLLSISSKPISVWLGLQVADGGSGAVGEGSPVERAVFLALIVAGILVLAGRRIGIGRFFKDNRWLSIFFLYLGISVLWSDYPFVSFKRWIKEIGNVIMVLVILTEPNPSSAARAVFARGSYVLIPFSCLLIKYYPELGRTYNQWTWTPTFVGVTTSKNTLGSVVLVCSLFLLWEALELYKRPLSSLAQHLRWQLLSRVLLMLMGVWLLLTADSMTSLSCLILGASLLISTKFPATQGIVQRFGFVVLFGWIFFWVCDSVFDLQEHFFQLLGRDPTLTGRSDIWHLVLDADLNPIIGAGFYSFWLGAGSDAVLEEGYQGLNQAHNGYIETYLNSGLIGLLLLTGVMISTYRRLKHEHSMGDSFATFAFCVLLVGLLYNTTEATFNRLSPVWFVIVLVATRWLPSKDFVGNRSGAIYRREPIDWSWRKETGYS